MRRSVNGGELAAQGRALAYRVAANRVALDHDLAGGLDWRRMVCRKEQYNSELIS
jgi:hypothetical protein